MLVRVLARVASGAATHLHVLDQLDVLLHLFLNALRNNTCCAILHDCVWMWVAAVGGGVDMLLALRGIIDADNTGDSGRCYGLVAPGSGLRAGSRLWALVWANSIIEYSLSTI